MSDYILFDGHNSLHRYDSVIPDTVVDFSGLIYKQYYRWLRDNKNHIPILVLDSLTKEREKPLNARLVRSRENLAALFKAMGCAVLEAEDGADADSLIGKIVSTLLNAGHVVFIESGDKDFAQLVQDDVFLLRIVDRNYVTYGVEDVLDRWGVLPRQFVDYQTLVGDATDNVAGIDGIGPKTAVKLLSEYGTIEGIVSKADPAKSSKAVLNLLREWLNGGVADRRRRLRIAVEGSVDITPPEMSRANAMKLLSRAGLGDLAYDFM